MHKTPQVDFPLLFFFVAFFIVILGLFSKLSFQKQPETTLNEQMKVVAPKKSSINEKMKSLNYNNPIQCNYTNKDSTISAQLDGTNLTVLTQKKSGGTRLIFTGDCLYTWVEQEKIGKKKCGLGQYMAIGKQLLGSGFASSDVLDAAASQLGKTLPADIEAMLESCNNIQEVKNELFTIPKGVIFE